MRIDNHSARGSVLVMVLGMLTILFILGSSFLVIAHMNAKTADAVSSSAQLEPVSEGLMSILKDEIGADRPIGNEGAYSSASLGTGLASWKKFVDYPSDEIDPWLATPGGTTTVTHPSNTHALFSFSSTGTPFPATPDLNHADTDFDGKPDSMYFDTKVTNDHGERYFAAVRIDDSSQFINLNTSGLLERTGPCTITTAADRSSSTINVSAGVNFRDPNYPTDTGANKMDWQNVNLQGKGLRLSYTTSAGTAAEAYTYLTGNTVANGSGNTVTVYPPVPVASATSGYFEILYPYPSDMATGSWTTVRSQRNPSLSMLAYAGSRSQPYLWPIDPFRPYGICEEAPLQLGSNAMALSSTRLGGTPVPNIRTVHSSSPNVSRQASRSFPTRFLITRGTLDDAANRQQLTNELSKLDDRLDMSLPASEDKDRQIAHFVANLWAATSNSSPENETFAVTAGTRTYYGIVEQLCFSEAFAFHYASTVDAKVIGRIRAFEITNPTDVTIRTYTAAGKPAYFLKCSGTTFALPNLHVDPGAKVVVYSFEGTGTNGTALANPFTVPASSDPVTTASPYWFNAAASQLTDFGDTPIELYRDVYPASGGTVELLADKIDPGELGYALNTDTTEVGRHGSRDDAVAQLSASDTRRPTYRGLLPVMKTEGLVIGGTTDLTKHTLGSSNKDVVSTDPAFNGVPMEGFTVRRYMPADASDLSNFYVIGPESETGATGTVVTDLPHAFLKASTTVSRGRLVPVPVAVIAADPNAGRYPDVPMHALVSEIVSFCGGDSSRADETISPLRVYGRININTADGSLKSLPWMPHSDQNFGTNSSAVVVPKLSGNFEKVQPQAQRIRDYIVAYRDMGSIGSHNYANRQNATNVARLRASVSWPGYASPAEIAVPLADYMNELMGWSDYTTQPTPQFTGENGIAKDLRSVYGYLEARDCLYRAVANMITVNSDTYTAHIAVQLRDTSGKAKYTWYYFAVFDRSSITLPRFGTPVQLQPFDGTHPVPEPAVLMFTRVLSKN